MSSILMSIKPEFVESILSGQKEYEYRKTVCKRSVDKMYIYSTVPVQKVVAEAEIEEILIDSPSKLWELTHRESGIDKDFFDKYFENKDEAVAYKLTNVKEYKRPKLLKELGVKTAPQSYQYVNILGV